MAVQKGSAGATTISFAWWEGSAPILWRTALQAEDRIEDYPGTPPPSVYQVTHGTALQATERHVRHLSCEDRLLIGLR
ncbi:MAG: hypothetical protein PUD84_03865 [Paraprevotella sp.]|nr:hypothetical protein [Paraprevotella sp.]